MFYFWWDRHSCVSESATEGHCCASESIGYRATDRNVCPTNWHGETDNNVCPTRLAIDGLLLPAMRASFGQMNVDYSPKSRRPIAPLFRKTADLAVALCVRFDVHPDAISYLSIVASLFAAVGFVFSSRYPFLLLLAPLLCFLRLWCNMLDGMVALASGKASPRGEILNDLPDRISDVLIFAGVAHSGLCNPFAAYWAMIGALLTAYVGTFGQAVGVQREFSGVMSKPWRMVWLALGAWVTLVCIWMNSGRITFSRLTILDWTCVAVIVGCVQTISIRLARIMRSLSKKR
jgi:phosphatidylglycerophosphate synthase